MPPLRVERYKTRGGADPLDDYLKSLPALNRAACEEVIAFLESGEIDRRPQHRRYLVDGIWELRMSINRMQHRILYTVDHGVATLLVAFTKKTQKTPGGHIDLARKRRRELQ